jgi:hypothetical protein
MKAFCMPVDSNRIVERSLIRVAQDHFLPDNAFLSSEARIRYWDKPTFDELCLSPPLGRVGNAFQ